MPPEVEPQWIVTQTYRREYWLSWKEMCALLGQSRFKRLLGKDRIKVLIDANNCDWYEYVTWEVTPAAVSVGCE